jgi:hypothetical protein
MGDHLTEVRGKWKALVNSAIKAEKFLTSLGVSSFSIRTLLHVVFRYDTHKNSKYCIYPHRIRLFLFFRDTLSLRHRK